MAMPTNCHGVNTLAHNRNDHTTASTGCATCDIPIVPIAIVFLRKDPEALRRDAAHEGEEEHVGPAGGAHCNANMPPFARSRREHGQPRRSG
jgi:hypothetical protein